MITRPRPAISLLLLLLGAGCSPGPGSPGSPDAALDAGPADAGPADAGDGPARPDGGSPACLDLEPAPLQGSSPFGELDLSVASFAAGDCITLSRARLVFENALGQRLRVSFSYPVETQKDSVLREVTTSFDTLATFAFRPPGGSEEHETAMIHVDVTKWREREEGAHLLDIIVAVDDPSFGVGPVRVRGTFCEWLYHVCRPRYTQQRMSGGSSRDEIAHSF